METKKIKTKKRENLLDEERLEIIANELKGKDLFPKRTETAKKFLAGIKPESFKLFNM